MKDVGNDKGYDGAISRQLNSHPGSLYDVAE
jgi:hypothetical protein